MLLLLLTAAAVLPRSVDGGKLSAVPLEMSKAAFEARADVAKGATTSASYYTGAWTSPGKDAETSRDFPQRFTGVGSSRMAM